MASGDVSARLDELRSTDRLDDEEWRRTVNGAKVLQRLFPECCEGTQYQKTVHAVALTKWLLENKPEMLTELLDYEHEFFVCDAGERSLSA